MNDSQEPELQPEEFKTPLPPEGDNIASRDKRFFAAMIDGFLGMLVSIPLFNFYGVWDSVQSNTPLPGSVSTTLTIFGLVMFFVLHGYLLFQYGQTIGKRLMGIAIVTMDGNKPNFWPLIANRYLPQWVAGLIPAIGPLLAIADVSYIFFNDQKRCVHDLIAGTKVIDLRIRTQGYARMEV
ncbi:MAG: RDD family protein [Moraxellaceae bacterium]|nr:MAG: RDD family protein [Moraxellaceae bacterium]